MKYTTIDGIKIDQFNEIMEELKWHDNMVYYMDDFNGVYSSDPYYAILNAFFGSRFGYMNDRFNPNDKYFTYDGYDNLVSIPEIYLQGYFDQFTGEILEYANDNEIELHGVEGEEDENSYF